MRGEVRLKSFTADPMAVTRLRRAARREDGTRALRDRERRGRPRAIWSRGFKGVADRDAAERLANIELYVPRDRLPPPSRRRVLPRRPDRACGGRRGWRTRSAPWWRSMISAPATLSRSQPASGGPTLMLPFTEARAGGRYCGRRIVVDAAACCRCRPTATRRWRRHGRATEPSGDWRVLTELLPHSERPHAECLSRIDACHVARDHPHPLPRHVSGPARRQPRRQGAGGRPLVARRRRHPRARDRQAPLRRRHARRRRPRHGDAAPTCWPRPSTRRRPRRHPPAPADEPARHAADPGAGRDAGAAAPAR